MVLSAAQEAMCACPPAAQNVLATLQDFRAAQEKRVRQYAAFERAFSGYLSSKDEAPYRYTIQAGTSFHPVVPTFNISSYAAAAPTACANR